MIGKMEWNIKKYNHLMNIFWGFEFFLDSSVKEYTSEFHKNKYIGQIYLGCPNGFIV